MWAGLNWWEIWLGQMLTSDWLLVWVVHNPSTYIMFKKIELNKWTRIEKKKINMYRKVIHKKCLNITMPYCYCPYTLIVRCGRVSGIKLIWWYWISVLRDYTGLSYLTIRHVQTVDVNDMSCLDLGSQKKNMSKPA